MSATTDLKLTSREISERLVPFFDAEVFDLFAQAPASKPGGILMGAPLWGREYIDRFLRYSLPSLAAPDNLEALAGRCRIVLYTPVEARPMLFQATGTLRASGIEMVFRTIPQWVMDLAQSGYGLRFCMIGAVQNIVAHMAARDGMGFHMLMVDHVYSRSYFKNLVRLAKDHQAIAQAGMSVDISQAAPALEMYRDENGPLVIPDRALGDIAAKTMHAESRALYMNAAPAGKIAAGPRLIWRSTEGLHIYSPFQNPAWLAPHLMADPPVSFTSTMDCLMPDYVPDNVFHVPTPEDGMSFVDASAPGKPIHGAWVTPEEWCEWWQGRVRMYEGYWPYFARPFTLPTTPLTLVGVNLPSAESVREQFAKAMAMLEQSRDTVKAKAASLNLREAAYV